ncbi:MAG: MBL fold metallo-hydrolase [Candidatus Binatia bacterium]|nr:MBL fold metallo-hydrolase [Candidatus Binatia bacterium]|tara:strand:- start:6 stop:908 length:903 start_codon:yes stop_codon:yes gene_type:complete
MALIRKSVHGFKRNGMTAKWTASLLGGFLLFCSQAALAQKTPVREIKRLAGDVYRFQNNFHFSVFMVTPKGIIVTDPINPDAAKWLKREIAKRFQLPVKYLIYSHDHADHIAGGEVFAETAVVVAHKYAKKHIIDEGRPTAAPQVTFSDRMEIELGGKKVELVYLGLNHSDNLIVMRFPKERILFAVDLVSHNRLPYRDLPNTHVEDWIESLKRMENMDFDILVPGHGEIGTRNDVRTHREYVEELRRQVLHHMRAGKSLEELKKLVRMEKYKDWGSYKNWLELNIEGMVRHLKLYRRAN